MKFETEIVALFECLFNFILAAWYCEARILLSITGWMSNRAWRITQRTNSISITHSLLITNTGQTRTLHRLKWKYKKYCTHEYSILLQYKKLHLHSYITKQQQQGDWRDRMSDRSPPAPSSTSYKWTRTYTRLTLNHFTYSPCITFNKFAMPNLNVIHNIGTCTISNKIRVGWISAICLRAYLRHSYRNK